MLPCQAHGETCLGCWQGESQVPWLGVTRELARILSPGGQGGLLWPSGEVALHSEGHAGSPSTGMQVPGEPHVPWGTEQNGDTSPVSARPRGWGAASAAVGAPGQLWARREPGRSPYWPQLTPAAEPRGPLGASTFQPVEWGDPWILRKVPFKEMPI